MSIMTTQERNIKLNRYNTSDVDTLLMHSKNVYSCLFNGIDENINFGNFSITDNLSVLLWMKMGAITATKTVFAKYHSGVSQRSWAISIVAIGQLRVTTCGTATVDTKSLTTTDSPNLEDDEWHLVGFTYVNNVLKIYTDGVERTTTGTDGAMTTIYDGSANVMGGALSNGGERFPGYIDEIGVWDTAVLSSSNITDLYNSGKPLNLRTQTTDGTLQHYYRMGDMDQGTSKITDFTGSSDGTFFNMTEENSFKKVVA